MTTKVSVANTQTVGRSAVATASEGSARRGGEARKARSADQRVGQLAPGGGDQRRPAQPLYQHERGGGGHRGADQHPPHRIGRSSHAVARRVADQIALADPAQPLPHGEQQQQRQHRAEQSGPRLARAQRDIALRPFAPHQRRDPATRARRGRASGPKCAGRFPPPAPRQSRRPAARPPPRSAARASLSNRAHRAPAPAPCVRRECRAPR
ncbi:hypothetical protein WR25_08401 [Diploscapter pachys]|uniref:Uncharacterized protein n=1 Tax=Diploscapter pachys TaxID=2018661 RepID=A0A2A2M4E6_9BILA|nr:hypothetical protein WR25_08401 [Diploscapter pachys]